MKMARVGINIFLGAVVFLAGHGCQSSPEARQKKEASTFRLHLEVPHDSPDNTITIELPRENPVKIQVQKTPFITEANVAEAAVVGLDSGFLIKIQLDRRGSWLLENYSASYAGRRVAVYSHFGPQRWLGAPQIQRRISGGQWQFTPDASLEAAQRFVRGLNNVAAKIRKREKF